MKRGLLKRPVTLLMPAIGLALLGLIAFERVPLSLMPNTAFPGLTIQTEQPGVSPDKIEEVLTRPLEDIVSTVGGIEKIFSVSEMGKSKINIEFKRGTEIDLKALEVRERVDIIAAGFPRDVQKPALLKYDPDQKPVFIITLESKKKSLSELREVADRELKKMIEGVSGVSEIYVIGGRVREILVNCDKELLQAHKLSMQQLLGLIQSNNLDSAAGLVERDGGRFSLYAKGRYRQLHDIQKLVVLRGKGGGIVRVRDVAQVSYAYRDQESASRVDGKERVSLYVHKTGEANLVELSGELQKRLKTFKRKDIKYKILYDEADVIRKALFNIFLGAGLGLVLVLLVFFLVFNSLKLSLLLLLELPFSALLASFLMFIFKFEYNLITISGMLLAAGLSLVYGTIALRRMRTRGLIRGNAEVRGPTALSIALIGAVFLPFIYLDEDMRSLYSGLAAVILFFSCAAFYYLHLLLPVIIYSTSRNRGGKMNERSRPRFILRLERGMRSLRYFLLQGAFRIFPLYMEKFALFLEKNQRRALSVTAGMLLLGVVAYLGLEQELVNPLQSRKVNLQIEFPSGTDFALTNRVAVKIEKRLAGIKGIREVTSKVDPGQASLILKLKEGQEATAKYLKFLERKAGKHKGAFLYFSAGKNSAGLKEVSLDVLGEDINELDRITRRFAKLAGKFSGVDAVVLRYKSPRPEFIISIDKNKAAQSGITADQIGRQIRFSIQGGVASKFIERNREIDIRIRYQGKYRKTLQDVKDYSFAGGGGDYVPLPEIARFKKHKAPVKIYRKNKKRTLSFTLRVEKITPDIIQEYLKDLRATPLPLNYRIEFGSSLKKQLEAQGRMVYVFLLAFLLAFMLLASFFESLTLPLRLAVTVPVPLLVVMIFLYLFGFSLTLSVFVGCILLISVVFFFSSLLPRDMSLIPFQGKGARDILASLFLVWLVIIGFFCPFLMIGGEGAGLMRGIALTLIVGLPAAAVEVPLLMRFTAQSSIRRKEIIQTLYVEMKSAISKLSFL